MDYPSCSNRKPDMPGIIGAVQSDHTLVHSILLTPLLPSTPLTLSLIVHSRIVRHLYHPYVVLNYFKIEDIRSTVSELLWYLCSSRSKPYELRYIDCMVRFLHPLAPHQERQLRRNNQ